MYFEDVLALLESYHLLVEFNYRSVGKAVFEKSAISRWAARYSATPSCHSMR